MRSRPLVVPFLLVLICLAVVANPASAINNKYTESFTTKQYCDTVNTSALWDTVAGELKLPPFQITHAGSYDTPGSAWGVAISGDYAYIADGESGLQVLNITNPASPTLAGSYDTPGYARGVAISGDYAYVADWTSGLQVINIMNPASPTLAGSYATLGSAYDVAIEGDYAYVGDQTSGLQVLDITNPASPTLAGSYDTPGYACGVAISGDYAYVADGMSGLQVIDITNPASPTLAGSYNTPGMAYGVAISGDYAYVADGGSGLEVLQITMPVQPTLAGSCDTPGSAHGVAISGDYAYVADGNSGLEVINITNPASPTLAGSYDTPGVAYDVAISGDYAYVADYLQGLQVLNITNPASPLLAGSYATPSYACGVAISGDYAYVADGYSGLEVINITNPVSPTLAGSYATPGYTQDVAIDGDYAYVTFEGSGLQVIDITNPASPTLAGSCYTPGYAYDVAISGDYAYVADDNYGLQVLNITNPGSPTLAGSYNTPSYAMGVAISGDYAYVADYTYGLQVINITNPASPTLAGYYDTPGGAHGVAISGEYAYVADGDSGLQVIGVFQRRYDTGANIGRSLEVDNSDNTIVGARLSSTQTDSIRWQVSANGGANWMTILPGSWRAFAFPGSDLRWRSTHYYAGGGINPSCTDLEIAWLYSSAMINDIADIADDQGGWVRLYFTRSWYDFANASSPIVSYYIWRRIDDASLVAKAAREGVYLDGEDASAALGLPKGFPCTNESYRTVRQGQRVFLLSGDSPTWESSLQGLPPGTWEVVGSVPALQQDQYIAAVPTLGDSTGSGTEYTVCCVSAHTTTPSVWYVSSPDSGYSVDNLAPAPPVNLRMTSPTALAWDESKDKDFKYFTVYGSGVPGLDSTATLIGYTIGTAMDVTGDAYEYYHVTASDFSGNEGDASSVENAYSGVNTDESIPAVFALRQNRPNPFSSKTSVAFDLPMGCAVSLRVFDAQGRQVKTLIDQTYPSGRHSVGWAGDDEAGNAVGSGIYFVRMEAGGFKATSKMLLTR